MILPPPTQLMWNKAGSLPNLCFLVSLDALAQLAVGDGTLLKITIKK